MSAWALGQALGGSAAFAEDFDRTAFERDPSQYLRTHYARAASSLPAELAAIGFDCRQVGLESVCKRIAEAPGGCAETLRVATFAAAAPMVERTRRCRAEARSRAQSDNGLVQPAGAALLGGPDGY